MPRLTLAVIATAALLAAGAPLLAQDAPPGGTPGAGPPPARSPQGSPPSEGLEGLKPLPAPHNDLPPIPAPPGAIFPGAKPKPEAAKPPVPQDREALLAELFAHLAHAPDAAEAAPIAEAIEGMLLQTDSATIGVLMGRSAKAINDQKNELALQLLDAVVELAPDYAEGWNRRAYVLFMQNNYEGAVGDLRRALALEPNHFKALEGLARILRETGQKKNALQAYKQILKINPYQDGAKTAVDELSVEVEGQGI